MVAALPDGLDTIATSVTGWPILPEPEPIFPAIAVALYLPQLSTVVSSAMSD